MAKTAVTNTEKDTKYKDDTLKKECEEAPKTGYTIKEVAEILIQRVIQKWRKSSQ